MSNAPLTFPKGNPFKQPPKTPKANPKPNMAAKAPAGEKIPGKGRSQVAENARAKVTAMYAPAPVKTAASAKPAPKSAPKAAPKAAPAAKKAAPMKAPPMPTGRGRKSAADILGLSEDNAVMKRLRAREAASKGK